MQSKARGSKKPCVGPRSGAGCAGDPAKLNRNCPWAIATLEINNNTTQENNERIEALFIHSLLESHTNQNFQPLAKATGHQQLASSLSRGSNGNKSLRKHSSVEGAKDAFFFAGGSAAAEPLGATACKEVVKNCVC
jgi:hypothetical protein